jgi:flagellar hook-basal body complex protein FliE
MAVEFGISMLADRLYPGVSGERPGNVGKGGEVGPGVAQGPGAVSGPGSFRESLETAITDVNDSMLKADQAAKDLVTGKAKDLHDVMITMEKADVSLRTLTAVRNKVVDAYQEIMRMQV